MVSIKFITLVLGLFTTCFIAAATLHQRHGDVHQNGLANDVEGIVTSGGKLRKMLFGGRKLLEDSRRVMMDGRSYRNGDLKSSGAVMNDENRAKRASKLSQSKRKKAGKLASEGQLKFQGKVAVEVSKTSSGSENKPGRSIRGKNENKQLQDTTASQLVNFLHKDYGGMDRPHRKPPVHNGEPFH
ncbi:hypothetical protein QQ045_027261 [Rhodiola kirilowii]